MDRIHSISRPCPYKCPPIIFEAINHKIINHLPRSVHEANILSSIWLGISLKMAQIINFWVDQCNEYWNNEHPPEMTYLRSAYWNEYGNKWQLIYIESQRINKTLRHRFYSRWSKYINITDVSFHTIFLIFYTGNSLITSSSNTYNLVCLFNSNSVLWLIGVLFKHIKADMAVNFVYLLICLQTW